MDLYFVFCMPAFVFKVSLDFIWVPWVSLHFLGLTLWNGDSFAFLAVTWAISLCYFYLVKTSVLFTTHEMYVVKCLWALELYRSLGFITFITKILVKRENCSFFCKYENIKTKIKTFILQETALLQRALHIVFSENCNHYWISTGADKRQC